MASIKHWCISPTSQKEQKPPRCTRHCFIYLFIFVSVSVRFSHLCCNQILYYRVAADFPAHSKKRLCNKIILTIILYLCCILYMDCAWGCLSPAGVFLLFFSQITTSLGWGLFKGVVYVNGERRISVYLWWWVEFFSSQVCFCYRCCAICTVVALCK